MSRHEERGSTLIMVIVLLLAFLLAAALLASQVVAHLRSVQDFRGRNQAFYLAEAGIAVVSERLRAGEVRNEPPPTHLRVDSALEGGPFTAVAVRVDLPTGRPTGAERPVYVVTTEGRFQGATSTLSARGVLRHDGLRLQGLHHGAPPEEWFRHEVVEENPNRRRPERRETR